MDGRIDLLEKLWWKLRCILLAKTTSKMPRQRWTSCSSSWWMILSKPRYRTKLCNTPSNRSLTNHHFMKERLLLMTLGENGKKIEAWCPSLTKERLIKQLINKEGSNQLMFLQQLELLPWDLIPSKRRPETSKSQNPRSKSPSKNLNFKFKDFRLTLWGLVRRMSRRSWSTLKKRTNLNISRPQSQEMKTIFRKMSWMKRCLTRFMIKINLFKLRMRPNSNIETVKTSSWWSRLTTCRPDPAEVKRAKNQTILTAADTTKHLYISTQLRIDIRMGQTRRPEYKNTTSYWEIFNTRTLWKGSNLSSSMVVQR